MIYAFNLNTNSWKIIFCNGRLRSCTLTHEPCLLLIANRTNFVPLGFVWMYNSPSIYRANIVSKVCQTIDLGMTLEVEVIIVGRSLLKAFQCNMNACDFKMVLTYNSYTCTLCQGASYTIYRASLEFYTVNN